LEGHALPFSSYFTILSKSSVDVFISLKGNSILTLYTKKQVYKLLHNGYHIWARTVLARPDLARIMDASSPAQMKYNTT